MRAGVAVAANDGHARLSQSKFGPDDVHNALFARIKVEKREAEVGTISSQHFDLFRRDWIGNWQSPIRSRQVVIDCGYRQFRTAHRSLCGAQALEGLWRCNLVN